MLTDKALEIYESLTNFEKRDGQREMVRFMAECIDAGDNGALEAPTGTGKSLALLVVAYAAWKEYGFKSVISTNTHPAVPRWRKRTSTCLRSPYRKGRTSWSNPSWGSTSVGERKTSRP